MNRWLKAVSIIGLVGVFFLSGTASAAQDSKTVPAGAAEQKKPAKYVGHSETKKYHLASCKMVGQMKPENRVELATKADAKKAGYEPCKICMPPKG